MTSLSKYKRTPNFTSNEKECLIGIIEKYAYLLEDKKTNRVSVDEKNTVWKKIEVEFNNKASIACYRNADQLRRLYENKKKELRKKLAEHKKQTFLTGGGPPPPDLILDYFDEILMKILNEKTVRGIDVQFDSDNFTEPLNKKQKYSEIEFEFSPCSPTNSNVEIVDQNREESVFGFEQKRCPPNYFQSTLSHQLRNISPVPTSSTSAPSIIFSKSNTALDICPKPKGTSEHNDKTPRVKNKTALLNNRRRPTTGIRALTSSDVAAKCNILLDRRLVLIEKQIEQTNEMQNFAIEQAKEKKKLLQLQQEVQQLKKDKTKIKIHILKSELVNKSSIL